MLNQNESTDQIAKIYLCPLTLACIDKRYEQYSQHSVNIYSKMDNIKPGYRQLLNISEMLSSNNLTQTTDQGGYITLLLVLAR